MNQENKTKEDTDETEQKKPKFPAPVKYRSFSSGMGIGIYKTGKIRIDFPSGKMELFDEVDDINRLDLREEVKRLLIG